jgi:carboxypeptidase C (cathepsin A)
MPADHTDMDMLKISTRAGLAGLLLLAAASPSLGADSPKPPAPPKDKPEAVLPKSAYFRPEEKVTDGTVTVGGAAIAYHAMVGTLVVHPKDYDDAPDKPLDSGDKPADGADKNPPAEAAMSYVAYLKKDAKAEARPIMFLFNGGPGSSTVWLHMGAFGPRRVVTLDDTHSPAAPYQLVDNASSLLDVADLVFVDAPGTGFGRLAGPNKEKAFWGVDQDAHAFADFITGFLSKTGRWNSPKYLFGESYGTTRSANLVNILETEDNLDFNGVVLLSQILNFDFSADSPEMNPGVDLPYELALPTYAATAFYHKKLPTMPQALAPFLQEVQHFALTDYALALNQGAALPASDRQAIIAKLHAYTGLPEAYLDKANLRVSGGEFEKTLQDDTGTTTGRLDSRFSGPTIDPLSKEADYDPQSAAISSAYVSAFNDYVRRELKFGEGMVYKPEVDVFKNWTFQHTPPGSGFPDPQGVNVMPDLAVAMKYNPNLKIMLNAGYYDLATPYFEGIYEMAHLQIPAALQSNIQFKFYESGHMVYAHAPALVALHDNVAAFVKATDNEK